jgi:hypothetical protein
LERSIESVHLGDTDDDGDLDILLSNRGETAHTVYSNLDGTGTSWSDFTYLDGRGTRIASTADINEDGITDIITGQASGFISIHYGFGSDAGCLADLTGDGTADIFDVLAFVEAYNISDLSVDFTGDGNVDIFDVLAFIDAYNTGCP